MLVPGITQAKGSTILYPREICLGWFSQSRPQMFCFPFLLLPEFGAGKSSGSGRLSTGSTLGNFRRILESCWRVLEFWWRDLCWWILPFLVPEKNPVILGFCFRKTTTCTENSPKNYGSIGKVTRLAGEISLLAKWPVEPCKHLKPPCVFDRSFLVPETSTVKMVVSIGWFPKLLTLLHGKCVGRSPNLHPRTKGVPGWYPNDLNSRNSNRTREKENSWQLRSQLQWHRLFPMTISLQDEAAKSVF